MDKASTTATIRGTVQDPSGGVLPGATVTAINTGTQGRADHGHRRPRASICSPACSPGTYDLKVELSGFKTYEQKGLALSPNDNRGIDVRLEIGQQTETVTVTSQLEVIQTETGAREGVLTAKQIDNLSVIGRSALELMRILPGVVTEFNQGESVGFGAGGNNTQGYTVNGIRSSGNTVSLDGSSLIDIGNNGGVIVSLNNDMVQEVKVQSSNFAAEYGTGGMSVSGVTKSGSSKFHGSALRLLARLPLRRQRPLEQHRRNARSRRAPISIRAATSAVRSCSATATPRTATGCSSSSPTRAQRQKVDSGSHFTRTYSQAMRNGDFSELLANRGSNLNSIPQLRIPRGSPGAGDPAPNNNMAPYITPTGKYFASLYPLPNYSDPSNLYNYVYSALEPNNRYDFKTRFDWNISNSTKAYVRIAQRRRDGRPARAACGGRPRTSSRCRRRTSASNRGRSYAGNVVSVLSPSMTNEVLVSYSRLTLDNRFEDPEPAAAGRRRHQFPGHLPGRQQPVSADRSPPRLGQQRPGRQPVGEGQRHVRPQRHAAVQRQADQAARVARPEVRLLGRARPEAAELPEPRGRPVVVRHRQQRGHRQLRCRHAGGPHRLVQPGHGTHRQPGAGSALRRVPLLEHRRLRAGQLEAALEPDARVRRALRLLDEQPGTGRSRRLLRSLDCTTRPRAPSSTPARSSASTASATSKPAARRTASSTNRSPFALPRVNVAWDIDGEGNNVLRGGYGMFYNRNMGNVEYDNTLRLAPNAYQVGTDFWAGGNYGNGLGLTYDTVHEATLASRIGSLAINTLTPDSFKFPTTHSFSTSFARRIPWNQVVEVSLRRHPRPRPGQPPQRQRHAVRRSQHRDLQRHRPVEPGQPLRGRHRIDQPGHVPPVQRLQWHQHRLRRLGPDLHLRLRRRVELRLDAGHAEPADRPGASSTSSPTHSARQRARSAASTRRSIRTTRPAPTACSTRIAPTSSTCRGTRSCRMARRARWTTRSAAAC